MGSTCSVQEVPKLDSTATTTTTTTTGIRSSVPDPWAPVHRCHSPPTTPQAELSGRDLSHGASLSALMNTSGEYSIPHMDDGVTRSLTLGLNPLLAAPRGLMMPKRQQHVGQHNSIQLTRSHISLDTPLMPPPSLSHVHSVQPPQSESLPRRRRSLSVSSSSSSSSRRGQHHQPPLSSFQSILPSAAVQGLSLVTDIPTLSPVPRTGATGTPVPAQSPLISVGRRFSTSLVGLNEFPGGETSAGSSSGEAVPTPRARQRSVIRLRRRVGR